MIICALVKHKLMHIRAPILYSITVDSIKFNKITKTVSSFQNLGHQSVTALLLLTAIIQYIITSSAAIL